MERANALDFVLINDDAVSTLCESCQRFVRAAGRDPSSGLWRFHVEVPCDECAQRIVLATAEYTTVVDVPTAFSRNLLAPEFGVRLSTLRLRANHTRSR